MSKNLTLNLRALISQNLSLSHLQVVRKNGQERIIPRNALHKIFLHTSKSQRERQVQRVIQTTLAEAQTQLARMENGAQKTELMIAAQRFNRIARRTGRLIPITLPSSHPEATEILSITAIEIERLGRIEEGATPVVHSNHVPAWGTFFRKSRLLRHREDQDIHGHPIDHNQEALRIFFNTQTERLLSLIGRICDFFGKLFRIELTNFKKYHYNRHQENCVIHNPPILPLSLRSSAEHPTPAPTSHWLGHASLLIDLPLRSLDNTQTTSFRILTDPVEGEISSFFYPRQTPFATPMNQLPPIDLFLLSHNHLDHFNAPTIRKLLNQQPIMVVPSGDGAWFRSQGFLHVHELNWWDRTSITFIKGEKRYSLTVTGVPARHWSGQGPMGGHESGFLGYVLSGNPQGSLLFSGDTARISEADLGCLRRAIPDLRWLFEPGGPDEKRADMETTHQASVDALWKHSKLLLHPLAQECPTLEEFIQRALDLKTIFMHTMTFKLGNLHLDDTKRSVLCVLEALENRRPRNLLTSYENRVLNELLAFCNECRFELPPHRLAAILRETVLLPKIGSTLDLGKLKTVQQALLFDTFLPV